MYFGILSFLIENWSKIPKFTYLFFSLHIENFFSYHVNCKIFEFSQTKSRSLRNNSNQDLLKIWSIQSCFTNNYTRPKQTKNYYSSHSLLLKKSYILYLYANSIQNKLLVTIVDFHKRAMIIYIYLKDAKPRSWSQLFNLSSLLHTLLD